jgi:hypothetical protein
VSTPDDPETPSEPPEAAGEPAAETAPEPAAPEQQEHTRFHRWVPLAIVIVSVFAAIMGWRASVADEHSNHDNELSRQDLVRQQQLQLNDIQQINAEARAFGVWEQTSLQAQTLRKQARQSTGEEAKSLKRQADSSLTLAAGLQRQVTIDNGIPFANTDGTLDPKYPYEISKARRSVALDNTELAALEPDRLRSLAKHVRLQGEYLTGLAALFVAAIVLFTLSAVSRGPAVRSFGLSGTVVGLVAAVLFIVVEVS